MQTNEPPAGAPALRIDVVSDVVCPWCWIGKGQLDRAIEHWRTRHPDRDAPRVAWHPFQLNPDLPAEGLPRGEYLDAKFGSRSAYPAERITRAAAQAGVPMHLARIVRQPNTLRAHALLAAAGQAGAGLQHALADALFRAYFAEGADIGDDAVLRACGLQAGLPAERIESAWTDETLQATRTADAQARRAGIGGVPFFVVGERLGVSGAQGVDALLDAFEQAAAV